MLYLMIQERTIMEYSHLKANPFIRIGAFLIDGILSYFLYFLLFSFLIGPIFSNTSDYKNNYNTYSDLLVNTHLFIKDSNGELNSIIDDFDLEKVEWYDETIINFYSVNFVNNSEEQIQKYQDTKKNYETIFTYNEETLTYDINTDIQNESILKSFFEVAIDNAVKEYIASNDTIKVPYQKLVFYTNISRLLGLYLALCFVFLLFPMIFKNGETLGKKMFGLQVVSAKKDDFSLNKLQTFIRFLCISIVEIFISLFTYGIPLLISLIIMIATKNKTAVHDIVAQTLVLDKIKIKQFRQSNYNSEAMIEGK